jgi:hypothetical protein
VCAAAIDYINNVKIAALLRPYSRWRRISMRLFPVQPDLKNMRR